MKQRKKVASVFALLVLALCLMPATISQAATKKYVVKAKVTYELIKGEKIKLYVKKHKKSKKVKWKSSNKKVATVSKKGVVTAKKSGTATITAKIGKKKYKTKVEVLITDEEIVYERDYSSEPQKDRYNLSDITIEKEKIVYNEWETESKLKEYGITISHLEGSNTISISGKPTANDIDGITSGIFENVPQTLEVNVIYGSVLRYKYNGTEFLFNTNDMINSGLLPQYTDVYIVE